MLSSVHSILYSFGNIYRSMKNAPTHKSILVISVKGRNMIVKFMILQNVRRADGKDDDDGSLWYIFVAAKAI